MTKQIPQNIDDLEAQRRELDRQIRAAKRAQNKAAAAALMSAQQTLGVDLARAAGAVNLEGVELLRGALMSGQKVSWLRREIGTEAPDASSRNIEQAESADRTGGDGHHDLV